MEHKEPIRHGHTKGIYVDFSDYDRLFIATEYVDDELRMRLDEIEKDTKVQMPIHPNADTILDMRTSTDTILEFSDVMNELENARKGFFPLGIICYLLAVMGMIRLLADSRFVLWWKRKKKEKIAIQKENARKEISIAEEQRLKKMTRKQRKEYNQKKNK